MNHDFWILFSLSLLLWGTLSFLSWRVEKWTDDWKGRNK